ncbi:MAG: helix-turn-helix domain-containing protein [Dysgonomonas sp.]
MKFARIQLDEISEKIDPFAIKNFIISKTALTAPRLSADYPFILDGIGFAICVKGKGHLKINFKEYYIEENTIITIMPHFMMELLDKTEDLMMEFLIFSVDFLIHLPSSSNFDISKLILQNPVLPVSDEEIQILLEFHSFIVKQYNRTDHPFRQEMAQSLLLALLTEVGAIYKVRGVKECSAQTSHKEELVHRFFKLLVLHHKKERSLSFYADQMCLTPKYLSTLLKSTTGRTAFMWINEITISSAQFLMKTTDLTILQISEELNFPNASFFGRFFKKHVKMTPVQYRDS